ncbi:hypothetical protein ScPMuIL_006193 [Solemya velum]
MPRYRLGKWKIQSAVLVIVLVSFSVKTWLSVPTGGDIVTEAGDLETARALGYRPVDTVVSSRHLLSLPNCTPRAVEQFPRGPFTQQQRQHGAIIIHIFIALYMFVGFALICDDYFVPSLELICDVLKINSDVAGATFMAAGSSAPELATAVIAVFIAKDDMGLGTVVGSAVYNVMFVISICALCAGMVVYLSVWPLIRDSTFYALSVIALSVTIVDENVYWYEALCLVCLYIVYIILMYFNTPVEAWVLEKFQCCADTKENVKTEDIILYDKLKPGQTSNGVFHGNSTDPEGESLEGSESDEVDMSDKALLETVHVTEDPASVLSYPEICWKKAIYIIAFPLKLLLFVSVPDCRQRRWRRWYVLTFTMSLVWLSAFSYLMVWMITIVGYSLNVPDSIMTLTVVAFGVSLPDVIASLIVVKDGYGDMAVANAVGSNAFDILICLGVPWLLRTLVTNPGEPVQVYSEGLLYASLTLLMTVVFLIVATYLNGWKLTKKYGVVLMIVYIMFTVLSILYEVNLFGYMHPKECPTEY